MSPEWGEKKQYFEGRFQVCILGLQKHRSLIGPSEQQTQRKILGYMGYVSRQNCVYENGSSFQEPAVYYCMRSANPRDICGKNKFKELEEYGFVDLRNRLNALFPETVMSLHMSFGNNTSDTEENHDKIHQP